VTEPSFSAIRARLRYQNLDEFIDGYARYITAGGMFIPMAPAKMKPVGTTVRFQFVLGDGVTALLGEGVVRQVRGMDNPSDDSPVGMLVKFTKLSQDSKIIVDRIVALKALEGAGISLDMDSEGEGELASAGHDDATPVPTESPVAASADDATPMPAAQLAPSSGLAEQTGELEAEAVNEVLQMAQQTSSSPDGEDTAERRLDEAEALLLGASYDEDEPAEEEHAAEEPAQPDDGYDYLNLFGEPDAPEEPVETRDVSEAIEEAARQAEAEAEAEAEADEEDPDLNPIYDIFGDGEEEEEESSEPPLSFGNVAEELAATPEAEVAPEPEPEAEAAPEPEAEAEMGSREVDVLSFWDDSMLGGSDEAAAEAEPEAEAAPEPEAAAEPEPELETAEAEAEASAQPEPAPAEEAPVASEPKALRETEAGLKVIAFDQEPLDDAAARDFEEFAFGGDEDDVDEMFDNIFGGGDDGDDWFGGGGGEEEGADLFGGAADGSDEPEERVAQAEEEAEFDAAQEEDAEDSIVLDEPIQDLDLAGIVDEADAEGDGEPLLDAGFGEPGLATASAVELDDDELMLEEGSEAVASTHELAGEPQDDSEAVDLAGFALPSEPEVVPALPVAPAVETSAAPADEEPSKELLSLLGSLEGEEQEEEEEEGLSLSFGLSASVAPPAPVEEEEEEPDSLSALLASAQKEIESKQGAQVDDKPKDILDELLGDDDLPPPPSVAAASPFAMPDPSDKKKKGFMSKLFGKD
jgi:hypothetical protein